MLFRSYHKQVRRGIYEHEADVAAVDISPASKSGNIKPGGEELLVSLDRTKPLEGEHHYRTEQELRVLFLKNKEDLEQQLARRGREIDQLVKQPDPAKKPEAEKIPSEPEH